MRVRFPFLTRTVQHPLIDIIGPQRRGRAQLGPASNRAGIASRITVQVLMGQASKDRPVFNVGGGTGGSGSRLELFGWPRFRASDPRSPATKRSEEVGYYF